MVVTGLVSEADVASPLRRLLGNVLNLQILLGEMVFNDRRYRYHRLIRTSGSSSSYFGHEEGRPEVTPLRAAGLAPGQHAPSLPTAMAQAALPSTASTSAPWQGLVRCSPWRICGALG